MIIQMSVALNRTVVDSNITDAAATKPRSQVTSAGKITGHHATVNEQHQ